MILFILCLLVGFIGLGFLAYGLLIGESPGAAAGGAIAWLLSFVVLIISMIAIVPPRSVGIQVTLGKVESAMDSGPHLIKPWSNVENFPNTMQTTKLLGDGKGSDYDGTAVPVRLANQTIADIHVSANWQLDTTNRQEIEKLYATWRSFGAIETKFIVPQLQGAAKDPFDNKYDPLAVLRQNGDLNTPTGDFEKAIREELQRRVGNAIRIDSVTIALIGYDQTTQEKINAYAQAVADTRIAEQRKATAEAQRQANDALAGSAASKDPAILLQNCLDVTERLTKEGKGLPAGWSCMGGGATPVVNVR